MRLLGAEQPFERHLAAAKQVLGDNWLGGYTRPARGLYPHQWNWDSAFIAIGYANYQPERGRQELRSLFQAQWPNGMVPHIVFNPDALGDYFPEPDFWRCPAGRQTSGITMPPLHSLASLHLHRLAGDGRASQGFLAQMFPKLYAGLSYLYRERDPGREGLVYIRHPWESGRDNAPAWDQPLAAIDLERGELPPYARKDLDHGVSPEQRPSDDDYDRYVYLVDLFRRQNYDERAIYDLCPFLIQDIGFNCLLAREAAALGEIAGILGRDRGELDEWTAQTRRAIQEKLWSERLGRFESFDLRAGAHLDSPTAMGFLPLFAGAVDRGRAHILYEQMNSVSFCGLRQGNCFTIPDFDMTDENFDQVEYWRGPVWFNINWLLAHGLEDYGYYFEAQILRKDLLELAARGGFREYYAAYRGRGLGSQGFSWSAALFLDTLYRFRRGSDLEPASLLPRPGKALRETRVLNQGRAGRRASGETGVAEGLAAAMARVAEEFFDPGRGGLDYPALADAASYQALRQALARLPRLDPAGLGRGPRGMALWLNLYNFLVIQGVIELGLSHSVLEAPNFFSRLAWQVGLHRFSLHDIHHGVLRGNRRPPSGWLPPFWPWDPRRKLSFPRLDPRLPFALCWGARSAAKIGFYVAGELEGQLEQAAQSYIASEVLVNPDEAVVTLAYLFQWYERDFGGRQEMLRFVAGYLPPGEHRSFLLDHLREVKVEFLFHDWHLNQRRGAKNPRGPRA
ncbi:MAG: DUF547 domain-containing protein [Deltaproteobacteria bacterium]|nr:DUF547 domain-containing protein [Deltaproteobacteria bacterium]